MKLKIEHLAKIEGQAGFVANIVKGDIESAKIEIEQGKRLIEEVVLSRRYDEVPIIVSRICGICPTVHQITSLRAIEDAFWIQPNEETVRLRKIMVYGQIIQSHSLHLFLLSMDKKILPIRDFINRLLEIIGGRSIHPITPQVAGFKKIPNQKAIRNLMKNYQKILKTTIDLAPQFRKQPAFERPTEFRALDNPYDEHFGSFSPKTLGEKLPNVKSGIFMLGALARINLYPDKLNPKAKKLLDFELPCYNPFMNICAQAIELVNFLEEIEKELNQLKLTETNIDYKIKAGEGQAACEAPRGTLYHKYTLDENGFVQKAEILTPTYQFIPNLEADLKEFVGQTKDKEKIKKLIRAYDPCISCAIH